MISKDYLYFHIIVEEGSISKAAKRIGVSQPYLSGFVSSLESRLNVRLIERNRKPLKLTDEGILFLKAADKIIAEEKQLENAFKVKKEFNNQIRIGVGSTRLKYLLGGTTVSFLKANSGIVIEIKEIINEDAFKAVENNEVDIVVHHGNLEGLSSEFLLSESLQYVALEKLLSEFCNPKDIPFISLQKNQAIRKVYDSYVDNKNIIVTCNNIDTALYYVDKGVGATIVPNYVAKTLNKKRFSISDLADCPKRDVYVSFKDKNYLSCCVKKFIDYLIKSIGECYEKKD